MKYKVPISVIMPCYNAQEFISEAIRSVLEQSFVQFELIIVNDGSTDNTEGKINQFKDRRIRYFKTIKNKGNYSARNFGISLATGKYICMMDSDDISLPNRLQVQYNFMESNRHVGCIGSLYEIIDEKGNNIHVVRRPLNHALIKTLLLKSCLIHQPTIMMRTYLIKKHNLYYDEKFKYAGDYDFFVRASYKIKLKNLNVILVKYRRHSNQISTAKKTEQELFADNIKKQQLKKLEIDFTEHEMALHLKLFKHKYINDLELTQSEFWLNKLLEANYKKKLYNNNHLYNLLGETLKAAIGNNALGGWSLEKEMLAFIRTIIKDKASILEFGSGNGTDALLERYKVTSIEHNKNFFFKRSIDHQIILAPIIKNWYNTNSIKHLNMRKFKLIIVDGPPGELRKGILDNLDFFKDISVPIMFDDVNRPSDKEVMFQFCDKLNYNHKILSGTKKEFAICTKIED